MINCKENKCKKRDNKLGVTWCIKCGKLFNKPCHIELDKKEIIRINRVS